MDEKDGYPVRFESVKGTLVALAELRRVEPKTSNPELYGRLGVEDPTQPGAGSTRVTAAAEGGASLCDLIVGDEGTPRGTRYVRQPGQGRAWQVRGQLSVDPRAVGWLDARILELPAARVRTVTLRHADGEQVRVAKQAADDLTWELSDVPAGREPLNSTIGRTVAGAFERLNFDDVSQVSKRTLPQTDPVELVLETFDGLRITVLSAPDGGGEALEDGEDSEARTWATLSVEVLPEAADDVRAEGESLQARLTGWIYALSPYQAANLRKRMQELTRQAAPPLPGPDAEPDAEPEQEPDAGPETDVPPVPADANHDEDEDEPPG
jgi:hypothetical protein